MVKDVQVISLVCQTIMPPHQNEASVSSREEADGSEYYVNGKILRLFSKEGLPFINGRIFLFLLCYDVVIEIYKFNPRGRMKGAELEDCDCDKKQKKIDKNRN